MKMRISRMMSLVLVAVMVFMLAACSGGGGSEPQPQPSEAATSESSAPAAEGENAEPVVINFPTSWVGAHPYAPYLEAELQRFTELYNGEIVVNVEEMPDDGAMEEKIRVLIAANDFPDVCVTNQITTVELAEKAGLVIDFKPIIEADSEWAAEMDSNLNDFWSTDGQTWPGVCSHVDSLSYFYNKELFAQAGLEGPAKTWDEFFEQCDALKAAGVTPVAMGTTGGGFSTSLWFVALFGTSNDAGNLFANTKNASTYETPEVLQAAADLKRLLTEYTTKDAVGTDYTGATNNFYASNAAMLATGIWMAADIDDPNKAPADLRDKLGVAMFPNDGVIEGAGYAMMGSAKDESKIDAITKFVKFFNDKGGQEAKLEQLSLIPVSTTIDVEQFELDPLLKEIIENKNNAKYKMFNVGTIYTAAVSAIASQEYSALALTSTPEEFCASLTKAAQEE